MAIKGLTDQAARLPRLGVLRKGEERPNGNRPGRDLDHFRFTSGDQQALEAFYEAYPGQPRRINVFLPYQTADENMDSWIEKWVAGGLEYRSDGENQVLWRMQNGALTDHPKPDPALEIDGNPPKVKVVDGVRSDGSKEVGRLSVIIPDLGRLATVTVLTSSKNDIVNLMAQLRMYESIQGDLRGIPFVLCRKPEKISTPGKDGKRARRESWLLSIETLPQWTALKMKEWEQEALPSGVSNHMLPESVDAEYNIVSEPDELLDPSYEEGWVGLPKSEFLLIAESRYSMTQDHIKYFLSSAKLINGDGYIESASKLYLDWLESISQFGKQVLDTIPFFGQVSQVYDAMRSQGMTYSRDDEKKISDDLVAYAKNQADREAANGS